MGKQEHVTGIIEQRIRSGGWKVSEKLPPERLLASSLGVSRNTLRAALQVLQGRGVLGVRRGSGTFVQGVPGRAAHTRQELLARLTALGVLFPSVAALCASELRPSETLELESRLSGVGLAVHSGSAADLARALRSFMRCVAEGTHNPSIIAAMNHVFPQGRFFTEALGDAAKSQHEALFAQLAGLLGGIRRTDPDAAAQSAVRYAELLATVCRPALSGGRQAQGPTR